MTAIMVISPFSPLARGEPRRLRRSSRRDPAVPSTVPPAWTTTSAASCTRPSNAVSDPAQTPAIPPLLIHYSQCNLPFQFRQALGVFGARGTIVHPLRDLDRKPPTVKPLRRLAEWFKELAYLCFVPIPRDLEAEFIVDLDHSNLPQVHVPQHCFLHLFRSPTLPAERRSEFKILFGRAIQPHMPASNGTDRLLAFDLLRQRPMPGSNRGESLKV